MAEAIDVQDLDHFARLSAPRRFDVDLAALQKNFLEQSRSLHPDFWRGKSEAEHAQAQRAAAALNEAYGVLRDEFKRAEYLILLLGGPGPNDDKSVPNGFLMEVFKLKGAIPKAKAAGDEDRIDAITTDLEDRLGQWRGKVATAFGEATGDGVDDAAREAALKTARLGQNVIVYLRNMLNELDS